MRDPFSAADFYEAFVKIAQQNGCGVCYSEANGRYVFAPVKVPSTFMGLTGALHPLRPDGNGAVA